MLKAIVFLDPSKDLPVMELWDDEAWFFKCPKCKNWEQATEKERAIFFALCSHCRSSVELLIDTPLNQILIGTQ